MIRASGQSRSAQSRAALPLAAVMPFEKTFWADRFGMLVDRYATPWRINVAGSQGM